MTDFFEFRAKITAPPARPAEAAAPPPGGPAPLTVSQLAKQVDEVLKGGFPAPVSVRGEISNANLHAASGHLYFTMKDSSASVDGIMWKAQAAALKFRLTDGMEVIATGQIKSYARTSKYQLYATRIEPVGQGALELALRQLREKLLKEGLLDASRKRPIPAYPRHIVLVTAQRTAALADMLKVLGRFKHLRVSVYHAAVQGNGAAAQLTNAINTLSARHAKDVGGVDVILLGRGGGSLEDLWNFNDEGLARAIVACKIPVITGIGHEVDTHIADLVADHHAHTPTAAAEYATRYWRIAPDKLATLALNLPRVVFRRLAEYRGDIDAVARHEFFRRPLEMVRQQQQRLDDDQRRLSAAAGRQLSDIRRRVEQRALRLERVSPAAQLRTTHMRLTQLGHRLDLAMKNRLRERQVRVEALDAQLKLIGPEQVLARGYTLTTLDRTGALLRSPESARPGDVLVTRTAGGELRSTVGKELQGDLFGQ
jgi:exodeoxyribonuclease VII large subunit